MLKVRKEDKNISACLTFTAVDGNTIQHKIEWKDGDGFHFHAQAGDLGKISLRVGVKDNSRIG